MFEIVSRKTKLTYKDHLDWFMAGGCGFKFGFIMGGIVGLFLFILNYFTGAAFKEAILLALIAFIFVPVFSFPLNLIIQFFYFFKLNDSQLNIEWKVNDDRLLLSDDSGNKIILPWDQVKKVDVKNKGFLIQQKPAGSRWIPNRVFNAEDRNKMIELISHKLG